MKENDYIYEELTLADLSERFLLNNDYKTPGVFDMEEMEIEVLTVDKNKNEIYKPILNFIVKDAVDTHYSDGKIKVSGNHLFIEDGKEIKAKDHPDFIKVNEPIDIVDIEVKDEHSFLANGRLNHNTTSGGKALAFHSSVRIRLKAIGQLKVDDNTIGINTRAQVVKNRVGPPLRSTDFKIFFDRGIDDYGSWLEVLKQFDIIKTSGAWSSFNPEMLDGLIYDKKFYSKDFDDIIESDDELRNHLYDVVCEKIIMKYKSRNIDREEVVESTDPVPEIIF